MSFRDALLIQMKRHGHGCIKLRKALLASGHRCSAATIQDWASGRKRPYTRKSLELLSEIEKCYGLPRKYFKSKLPEVPESRAVAPRILGNAERHTSHVLRWHLPADFDTRSPTEQSE